ncbi:hypothetical protein [Microbacterium testaceum]|uniref:Uncharacterized protein n=1 Tax=Microbacterium testaceum TaxID=2033 RepID=A0A2T7WPM9_MICTE|nr:hypothetical protein [Microbacterium testaceum]PVE76200.1 hypothetical protein DC432_06140 [Microbacterium testaceum]
MLEGDFVEVSRRGWFAIEVDFGEQDVDLADARRVKAAALAGHPVKRAKQLEETEICLGFVPHGVSVVNDPDPVSPWEWARDLQDWPAASG